MKAAQINNYGNSDVINVVEVDKPAAGPGQVLVEVYAASINPFDSKLRDGEMQQNIPINFPLTLGGDLAGKVAEVGAGVSGLAIGDSVYGQAAAVAGNSGAFAEFAATQPGQLAKSPSNVDFGQAAALPLVGVSAWQALNEHIKLQAGQKIFIHGGAGGIGTVAIQIAKHLGAYVATTATGDGLDYVKQLGADEVIDYKTQDFATTLSGYDAVYDCVGGPDLNKALSVLKTGGIAVSMTTPADEALAKQKGVTALVQATKVTTEKLDALRKLVEDGVVTPHVDKAFSLNQVRQAFKARESGTVKGKVVLKIKD